MRTSALALAIILAAAIAPAPSGAQINQLPAELEGLGVTQRLGEPLPLDLAFVDDAGETVRLGELIQDRPALLAPVYYDCPMVCNLILEGVARSLKAVGFIPGRDFDVIAVSFDDSEGPAAARAARRLTLEQYGDDSTASGWHFLTGKSAQIRALTAAMGFPFRKIEETGEFAHASMIAVVTADGLMARYFNGIEYPPRDVRLALIEAGDGKIGSLVDQVVLFCYRYDPTTGKYSFAIWVAVRSAGILTAIVLALFLFFNLRRERREFRASLPAESRP